MEKKRDSRLTVDLLAYKQPWLDWCQAQNLSPSDAFRKVVARLVSSKAHPIEQLDTRQIEKGLPEKPSHRKEISLTESELKLVEALAAKEGFSVSKWIVALVRARLTGTPQFGQTELELLARSNLQLLAIGRNLNQVAKALNTSPHDHSVYRIEMIEVLAADIKAHTKVVSDAMSANLERWRIK